jgi:serine/threonine-protein kinase
MNLEHSASGWREAMERLEALVRRKLAFIVLAAAALGGFLWQAHEAQMRPGNAPEIVDSFYALARVQESAGRFADAAETIGRGLTVAQAAWGESGERIPAGRHMRSRVLLALGRYTEGEEESSRAAEQFLSSSGENHWRTLEARDQLAVYLDRRGKHDEAVALLRKSLVQLHELRGPEDALSVRTELDLGAALVHAGQVTEADERLSRLTRLRGQPRGSPSLATARLAEGRALELLGDLPGAAQAYEEARTLRAKERGEEDALTGPPFLGLAEVALARGDLDAAGTELQAATVRLGREEGWTLELRRQARVLASRLLLARGKPEQALAEVRRVLAEIEGDPERAYLHAVESSALLVAARAQLALGRPQEAVTPAGQALEILRRSQWAGSPTLLDARLVFAEGLAATGDAARARKVFLEASAGAVLQPRAAAAFQAELHGVATLVGHPD